MANRPIPDCSNLWLHANNLPWDYKVLQKDKQELLFAIKMFTESVFYLCDIAEVVDGEMTIDDVCDKLHDVVERRLREEIESIKIRNM